MPEGNEVLISIHATTVTSGDCEQRNLKLPIWYALPMRAVVVFKRPTRITILGMELAGDIESVGKDVKRFRKGDQVFAATGFIGMGACAEYICLTEEPEEGALAIMPANMTYEQAAPVPVGGLEALSFLRQGDIQSGQKVLTNGAGGTIGTYAVQLAKHYGARVTSVCGTQRLEFVRSLGADNVIDYTKEDSTQNGETYDLILDVLGKSSFSRCKGSLKQKGVYLLTSFKMRDVVDMLRTSVAGSKKVKCVIFVAKPEDLVLTKELIETGKLSAIIDKSFPLEQTAKAHRYVEAGNKKGYIAITVGHNGRT